MPPPPIAVPYDAEPLRFHPCIWLGHMFSSPWRVSATHIFCLFQPHLTLHHPPRKRVFQLEARVAGTPLSFWLCGPKDRSPDLASLLSPTCLHCALVDFCCGYLPYRIRIRHLKRLLHGYRAVLCGAGSNGLEVSFS